MTTATLSFPPLLPLELPTVLPTALPIARHDSRGNVLIERAGKTLAVINPFGLLDWLDCGDLDPGLGLLEVGHEVHLSGCRGVQLCLVPPLMTHDRLDQLSVTIASNMMPNGDVQLVVTAVLCDHAGNGWLSTCHATYDHQEWLVDFTVERQGSTYHAGGLLELTDVHPGVTGRGILLRDKKRFTHIVIHDDNISEKYPHQHAWHSGEVLNVHQWHAPTAAAFVDENFVGEGLELAVSATTADPVWAICDMYYDVHLFHRATTPIHAHETITARCHLRRISAPQALMRLAQARNVTGPLREYGPRIDEGNNSLTTSIAVDRPDEAHHFLPSGPHRQWTQDGGRSGGGRLLLRGDGNTDWHVTPPLHLRPGEPLIVTAWVRGSAVELSANAWTWQWPSAPSTMPGGETIAHSRDASTSTATSVASADWVHLRVQLPAPDMRDHAVTARFGFTLLQAGSIEICDVQVHQAL